MITVIYTTVRAEITHDKPFDNKFQALEYAQELLDYASVLGGSTTEGDIRVTDVEVVDDEVESLNDGTEEDDDGEV